MKKITLIILFGILIIIGVSLLLFLFRIPKETPPQPIFIQGLSKKKLENLTLDDLPNVSSDEGYRGMVRYGDNIFALGKNHILQYDLQGNLIAFTDPNILNCPWPGLRELALTGDLLFTACQGKGIYEIDLQKNSLENSYNEAQGFPSVINLDLTVDGNDLWVGSFDEGVARMDTRTKAVRVYKKELGVSSERFSSGVRAYNGDIWVEIGADAYNEGGLAHYKKETDTWKLYTPKDFKSREFNRIDFSKVIVSQNGVFVEFQDGGPDYETISKYNPETQIWEKIFEAPYQEFQKSSALYLPDPETYPSIRGKEYKAFSEVIGNTRYIAYERGGIDTISAGENFPSSFKEIPSLKEVFFIDSEGGRFFTTPQKEYTIFLAPDINAMGGEIMRYIAVVISNTTKETFETEIKNNEENTLLPASIQKWEDKDVEFDGENIFLGEKQFLIHLKTKTISVDTKMIEN